MSRPAHGGNLTWAATLANCPPQQILDFSASINPLGPPHSAIAAIQAQFDQLRDYPDPEYRSLRQSLAEFHQLAPEWILPGNGSAELLTWACRELAAQASTYLITPAFGDYWRALKAFSASVSPWPLNLARLDQLAIGSAPEWGSSLPLESLIAACDSQASSAFGVLLNNPHNPTGQCFSQQSLLPLLDRLALVVIDEAFMDFLRPEVQQSLLHLVPHYPNLVILRSLTKFYSLPGLRLGYAVAHPERLQRWQQWRDPWSVNTFAVAAAAAVVQDHEFMQQTWNWLEAARSQLFDGLAAIPGLQPYPGAANFLLVHSQHAVPALQERLLQQSQILIRDCLSFPELGDRYFRVAVRTEAENQRLLDGLHQLL